MKKLIIAALIPLLVGCTEKYVLHANLKMVTDKTIMRQDGKDSFTNIRLLSVIYLATNNSNDSIFIPIGSPYLAPVAFNVKSRDSMETSLILGSTVKNRPIKVYTSNGKASLSKYVKQHYAPRDSFFITFYFSIRPKNGNDSEWLEKVPTKELMSKLELKLVIPAEIKDADKIPDIIFHNDTDDICINPIIKPKNRKSRGQF